MSGFASLNAKPYAPDAAWTKTINAAFPTDLRDRVVAAASRHPDLAGLFGDIAQHVHNSRQQPPQQHHADPVPAGKKRKLENGSSSQLAATAAASQANGAGASLHDAGASLHDARPIFSCKDVSFQIPMRKKLKLDLAADARDPARQELRLVNQTSQETEYTLRAEQLEQAFCMAVPDKQARQTNFVLYPRANEGMEPVVFALNDTAPAVGVVEGADTVGEDDTYATVTGRALDRMLRPVGLKLVRPTDAEFASAIPQSHRKGEKGYHVRAHRGNKEGYLFFLPTGIFFGFKKPLAFFPFAAIESISYTSVLQRTFNLVVTTRHRADDEPGDTEFSMLDQADFAGIDEYVKRHGLNDASMAAQRRAKAYNVNKVGKAEGGGADGQQVNGGGEVGGEGEDGMTELQRAEQALQDAEDEEEEDYEASGGESEGEGEDSEEDEEGEGEYDGEDGEDAEGEEDL